MQSHHQSVSDQCLTLQPSVSYYLKKMLRQNLSQLKSVVLPGAAITADSFNDLNAVIESLYLEPAEIQYTIRELERLVLIHQHLIAHEMTYAQELKKYEENIFWLLGFKYTPRQASKILVVDDNVQTLTLLTRALKRAEYEVYSTAKGNRVPVLAHAFQPNLILMDVIMPELNGFEVLKLLQASDDCADIPVIFVSSAKGSKVRRQGLELGATDYITKPFNLKKVMGCIRQWGHQMSTLRAQEPVAI